MPELPGYPLDALLDALDEGVLVFDDAGICRAAGRRAAELLGVDPASLAGLPRAEVLGRAAAVVRSPEVLATLGAGAVSAGRTVVDPVEVDRPHPRTVVWTSLPLGVAGRLDVLRDVTRERRAEAAADALTQRLELEGTLDDLTGLTNRRRFEEECAREHRRSQREWISYGVARVDVDGMGAINAAIGVAAGDELLRRLGEELRAGRREYDVVARWKDDELVLLLPRVDTAALVRILRRAIDAMRAKGAETVPGMSVCVGAAIYSPPSAEGPAEIIERAGRALAKAKARGRGKVELDAGTDGWKGGMDEA
jgi:diguanylate cyclase (GGDEF)-like protein